MRMKPIRNSTKAIIIDSGRILAVRHVDSEGDWYVLPGGGQEHGETLKAALQRECIEEIGVDVIVGKLLYIREYIGKNHEFWEEDGESHQLEFMFDCKIVKDQLPTLGSNPDPGQLDCAWLQVEDIMEYRLYPLVIRELLNTPVGATPMYLGDIN